MPSVLAGVGQAATEQAQQLDELGAALAGVLNEEMPKPTNVPVPKNEIPDDELGPEADQLPGEEGEGEEDGEYIDQDDLPSNIKERAEALEVDPSFFYDAAVTLNDGTSMTIGELKDAVQAGGSTGNIQAQQQQVLAQQQQMQAEHALREQYGEPISQYQHALKEIEDRYKGTNWKELTDEHGDKAELAKIQMQQQYSQTKAELDRITGEYQQAMGGYANQVAQAQLQEIVKTHPSWTDQATANVEMQEIHKAIAGTGITYDQMLNEIGGMGGAAKLAILELAAKGAAAGNIEPKKVRKVARSLRGGRTISATQQKRMQQAKSLKAAKGGTRRQQQDAAVEMIKAAGGL